MVRVPPWSENHLTNARPDSTSNRVDLFRIRLLGGFAISVDERSIAESAWRLSKAKALVQILALSSGHRLHREQVMDLFWPDLDITASAGNLYQVVHAARRALNTIAPPHHNLAATIHFRRNVLSLSPPIPLWIDVDAFEAAALAALSSSNPAQYRAAISLYAGDLLPEHPYEDWIAPRRELLRDRYWTLLIELGQLYERMGDYPAALDVYKEAAILEPTTEHAHAGIMRIEAFLSQRARALEQYEKLKAILTEELGVEPTTETRQLRDEIAEGRTPSPIHKAGAERPGLSEALPAHNLPVAPTSFVGREREIVELEQAMVAHRLLTISGPGGSGKTRLALAVASERITDYPDGVWLVTLSSIRDPAFLAAAVGNVLNIPVSGDADDYSRFARSLDERCLLLILDGCEHLIDACADLATALLTSCPNLRILVTSREPLHVAGEVAWRIPLLELPDPKLSNSIVDLQRVESVKLFMERAILAMPGFKLTASNARAVVTICRRVDGLPLAIELAAAKLRGLGIEQVAARLDHSLDMLTRSSARAGRPRETLVSTLDWSYSLLTEAERTVFQRLATFIGGSTVEAAELVAAGEDLPSGDVLDLLIRLADKSLLQVESVDRETRYRMLDTVQQYARERLHERGELAYARQRHAEYFIRLIEPVDAALRGSEQASMMKLLNREHENLRAAIEWFIESGQTKDALRFGSLLSRYWALNGNLHEGRMWLGRTLAVQNASDCAYEYIRVLWWIGRLAYLAGDYHVAEQQFLECLNIAGRDNDLDYIAAAQNQLGHVAFRHGDLQTAEEYHRASLHIRRQLGDPWHIAMSLRSVGHIAMNAGSYESAWSHIEESLQILSEQGDTNEVAHSMFRLGQIAHLQREYDVARQLQEGSLARWQRSRNWQGIVRVLKELGFITLMEGDLASARTQFANSLAMHQNVGSRLGIANCLEGYASVLAASGQPEQALYVMGNASAVRDAIGEPPDRVHQVRLDDLMATISPKIPESRRNVLWLEGRATPLEQVVEYLLTEHSF